MLKNYMHKRERYYAMLNDNRVVQPFAFGAEFVTENVTGTTRASCSLIMRILRSLRATSILLHLIASNLV